MDQEEDNATLVIIFLILLFLRRRRASQRVRQPKCLLNFRLDAAYTLPVSGSTPKSVWPNLYKTTCTGAKYTSPHQLQVNWNPMKSRAIKNQI